MRISEASLAAGVLVATFVGPTLPAAEKSWYAAQLQQLTQAKRWQEAEQLLQRALREYPQEPTFRSQRPWIYVERGLEISRAEKKSLKAAEYFERAFQIAPELDYVYFHYAVGAVLYIHEDFALAVRLIEAGMQKFPKNQDYRLNLPWAYVSLARAHDKAGRKDAAFELRKKAFELQIGADWVWLEYAIAVRDRGRFDEAIQLLSRCEQLFPKYPHCAANIPWSYYLRFQARTKTASQSEIIALAEEALSRLVGAPSFDATSPYLLIVTEVLHRTTDDPFFQRVSQRLLQVFPKEWRTYELLGYALVARVEARGPVAPGILRRAIELRRAGRLRYDALHPQQPIVRLPGHPLRGSVLVATSFDADVWSHVGAGKFCYDLMTVDARGSTLREGTSGRSNSDYHSFGADLFAAADGVVERATTGARDQEPGRRNGDSGNTITIQISPNHFVYYDHLQHPGPEVRKGDRVRRGQRIGRMGNTGASGGPHLHFCVWGKDGVTLPFEFPATQTRTAAGTRQTSPGPFAKDTILEIGD